MAFNNQLGDARELESRIVARDDQWADVPNFLGHLDYYQAIFPWSRETVHTISNHPPLTPYIGYGKKRASLTVKQRHDLKVIVESSFEVLSLPDCETLADLELLSRNGKTVTATK